MLLNYLKLSFRLMARNPFFTLINIVGLGIGFASFFALWDFSINQLQADQYHKDFERIARIGYHWKWTDDGQKWDGSLTGFSKSDIPLRLKEDFAEVEDFTRIHTQPFFFGSAGGLVPHGREITMSTVGLKEDRIFKEEHIIYADHNLFNFFSIPLLSGKPEYVLESAGSVVLSESQAIKYFDRSDPVGKLLNLNDTITLRVTGVFQDLPHNTHLNFNIVISNRAHMQLWASAVNGPTFNYIKVSKGTSFVNLEEKINERRKDYTAALLQRLSNTDIEFIFQPLKDIIFHQLVFDEFSFRSKSLLVTFAIVSIVLLAMAWINYINLWIARNKLRAKELATRKINGARGKDFILQFLTEAIVVNFLSVLVALTLMQFLRMPFETLFNIPINNLWEIDSGGIAFFGLVILFSIGLTGLYPVLIARKNPTSLFRNTHSQDQKGLFSSALVIVQYVSAVALILWSSIIYLQLNFVLQHDVGFDRDNVMIVEVPPDRREEEHFDALLNRLRSHSSIGQVTYAVAAPTESLVGRNTRIQGKATQIGFEWNGVSETYLPLFDLKLIAGRNFVRDDRADVALISEIAAKRWGFENPADAVGTKLEVLKSEETGDWIVVEVIGIFKEYRSMPFFETEEVATDLKNEFQSKGKMFTYKNRGFQDFQLEKIAIKLNPGDIRRAISAVENEYKGVFPGTVFTWSFLEDRMNSAYVSEKTTRNQILLFVILAIVIACLGFLGMITHKVISRTKELGIRKVLGASLAHIGRVILQPSFVQFGISIVIGIPIAWYLGQQYIQKFSHQVALQWWHFTVPVIVLILIMLSTVASVLMRAASRNPVEALKHE